MNIVIADGHTLNPGDLSWAGISKFGNVSHYERTPRDLMPERCAIADIILTNKAPVSADVISRAPNLKLICVTATGYNIVDVESAKKRGIAVCNVPDYGTSSVAQHTFALILELSNLVGANSSAVKSGDWVNSSDFCFSKSNLTELSGKTIGIVGLGKIGSQVARLANAFEMNVIYNSKSKKDTTLAEYRPLEELLEESDIITLHCPLTKDNLQFINADLLQRVKRSAWLINTSRGQLIQEAHLAQSLNDGSLAAAALDVLSTEPPPPTNPLLKARNCLITPHTAWMSFEARSRILQTTEKNIDQFLKGAPANIV